MEEFDIRHLTFFYPGQETPAINDISFTLKSGEFAVLCGPSGCGKSTLLRCLKTAVSPHGSLSGEVLFEGKPLFETDASIQCAKIGFVQQSPENQVVTDKVWHELAFGLESLGLGTPEIRRRVSETASFFGIQTWFYNDVSTLSGGQKQLLNLASVMAMQPSALILDEPTSQLDPIAASELLSMLGKINRELGTAVLLTEHRLEEALLLADKAAVMDKGRLLAVGAPKEVAQSLKSAGHSMFLSMPASVRIWSACKTEDECPLTVAEGRKWLADFSETHAFNALPPEKSRINSSEAVISAENVWVRYEKDAPDVIKGLNFSLRKGEFLSILGGNGTGKTTTLKALAGIIKPYRGEIRLSGRVGMLPQSPQTLFVRKTVREELFETFSESSLPQSEKEKRVYAMSSLCRLNTLLERHPYDLSGGEQQRAALAKVLLTEPDILLLDEPTKGLDAQFKLELAGILKELLERGTTVLAVSHDTEFCASFSHRCALFFDGSITAEGTPREFFSGNSFYTTAASRLSRGILPDAVTAEDVISACGGTLPDAPELFSSTEEAAPHSDEEKAHTVPRPVWKRVLAAASGCAALVLLFVRIFQTDLSSVISSGGMSALSGKELKTDAIFILLLFVFAFCTAKKPAILENPAPTENIRQKIGKRTVFAAVLIVLLIPLTLFFGEKYLGGRKYFFITLLVLIECMAPFFLIFERRRPQARELVTVAVLCALGVAGRAAFFMLPNFKPVMAVTIIAGAALGGETGFLVGAITMLASNVMFSQGPWTPWQMFAMGIIGFLSGVLFRRELLPKNRITLCCFGAVSAIVIYGGIMNPASAIIWTSELNKSIILTYYLSGFPMDCVHAAATWLFLWFASEPMLEKLERLKTKYGLAL